MSQSDLDTKLVEPVEPVGVDHEDHPETISRNSRYGLILFSIYCLFYGGFVLLSAFAPHQMASRPFGGANLAVLYGAALIFGALVLAAIYMYLCRAVSSGSSSAAASSTAASNKESSK